MIFEGRDNMRRARGGLSPQVGPLRNFGLEAEFPLVDSIKAFVEPFDGR